MITKDRVNVRQALQESALEDPKVNNDLENHMKIMFQELHQALQTGKLDAEKDAHLHTLVENIMDRNKLYVPEHHMSRHNLIRYYVDAYKGYGPVQKYLVDNVHSDIKLSGRNRIALKSSKGWDLIEEELFKSNKEYEDFVERCFRKLQLDFNPAVPIQNGFDHRWQVRLNGSHRDITPLGSQLVIRKRLVAQLDTQELLHRGTMNEQVHACLQIVQLLLLSTMVGGDQNTGKTTFLGWFLDGIPQNIWVNTHQDTDELFLNRKTWTSHLTRPGTEQTSPIGQIELIQNFYRESGQAIAIGEVRDDSTFHLLNASSGGSPAYCSVHGPDVESMFERCFLLSAPVAQGMSESDLIRYFKKFFPVIVVMEDEYGKKRVKQIGMVDGNEIKSVLESVPESNEWKFNGYPEWFVNRAKARTSLIPKSMLEKAGVS